VPINVDSVDDFVPLLIALAPWAQDGDFVAVLVQRAGFFPDTSVKGDRQVLYDNKNFLLH
jgi:hypothetical protein